VRATRALRRWVFFWQGVPRTPEAEESLTALLTRRDQVRAKQTAPVVQPNPDLFQPEKVITDPLPTGEPGSAAAPAAPPPIAQPKKAGDEEEPASTTSRLLEAKRRAQKRKP
jgi:hypothetical protein